MHKRGSSLSLVLALCLLTTLVGSSLATPNTASARSDPRSGAADGPAGPTPQGGVRDFARLEGFWQDAMGGSASMPGAQTSGPFRAQLLARAEPDECFNGIGNPYPPGPPCSQGQPKVNQAYVWGLAKSGNTLWFGTAANVLCLVIGGILNVPNPVQTPSYVCEFGKSQYAQAPWSLPASVGDWRPPHIYTYDTANKVLTDRTPTDRLLMMTLGLRSAMSTGKAAILAGPSLGGGINLFAFNTETGAYLGSKNLPQYSNIRKWLQVGDVFYAGVRNSTGGGSVLRWKGNGDTLQNLFDFDVVGTLETEAAELASHEGRVFVSTWPELAGQVAKPAGLYMSPVEPQGGLTGADAQNWTKVWQVTDYEPDPVTAASYGGGALASFGGYLYWGTMHVPFAAAIAHFRVYGPPKSQEEVLTAILATNRAVSIFRGRNFGGKRQKIEVAYGMARLPSYSPAEGWKIVPNKMNATPLYGPSGFGNLYNNYTWSMAVYHNQLFVGTMDWSFVLSEALPMIVQYITGQPLTVNLKFPIGTYGADLWRFPSSKVPAVPVSLFGVDNPMNYGVRNMLSADALYLGMANPMNLLASPDAKARKGGWELIKLAASK